MKTALGKLVEDVNEKRTQLAEQGQQRIVEAQAAFERIRAKLDAKVHNRFKFAGKGILGIDQGNGREQS